MTVGTSSFKGLAVPLKGESKIKQLTAATDILTIEGASAQTGDFLVLRDSSEAEKFVVNSSGQMIVGQALIKDNGTAPTAADMTVNGQIWTGFSTSGKLYVRQNGTLYYFQAAGTIA